MSAGSKVEDFAERLYVSWWWVVFAFSAASFAVGVALGTLLA